MTFFSSVKPIYSDKVHGFDRSTPRSTIKQVCMFGFYVYLLIMFILAHENRYASTSIKSQKSTHNVY